MDFRFKKLAWYVMPSVVALALAGCGSDSDSKPVDPTKPTNPEVTLPTVTTLPDPTEIYADDAVPADTLVLSLIDQKSIIEAATKGRASASDYAGYNLYIWNDTTCAGVADGAASTSWDDVSKTPTKVDNYGPYWEIPVNPNGDPACINVIVRDASKNKVSGNSDLHIQLSDRQQSLIVGGELFATRAEAFAKVPGQSVGISNAAAHLIDAKTVVWEGAKDAAYVNLYFDADGGIAAGSDNKLSYDKRFDLKPTTLTDAQKAVLDAQNRAIKEWSAFTLPDGVDIKTLLKGELVAVSTDSKGVIDQGTKVQTAIGLDGVYADAAKKLEYGAIVGDAGVTFRVWAPTAQKVSVVLYDAAKVQTGVQEMTLDASSGSWSYTGDVEPGTFYRYALEIYNADADSMKSYEVTDPYSLSLSTNSEFSQVVDLNDAALKPDGWDTLKAPHSQATQKDLAKIVIHESHVRDLTAFDTGIDAAERGKFVALTDDNSLAVKHLKELSAAGVTHLQLLPAFDIATVNEDPAKVANLDDKFSKLCEVNSNVKNSADFNSHCSGDETIADVLASLDKDGEQRQALNRMVSETDSFNWGYDPFHYTTPEGSYSTNPDGTARILEFRKMVKAIKENIGMNVVMDVVYNHTNAAGLADKSVLDKVVPGYYQRLDPTTGAVTTSTCCSNTAPENAMFAKLMDDSLVTWATQYKVDAFRFDLMGHHPKAQMVEALAKVKAVAPEMYFYGEGWDFGEVAGNARFEQATQPNLAGTGIGSFSDRLRDAVRGGSPFDGGDGIRNTQGFGNGALVMPNEKDAVSESSARHLADLTMLGMAGNLKEFVLVNQDGIPTKGSDIDYNGQKAGYAQDPIEIQNYVSKHDNQTLFDIIAYKAPTEADLATRVRMQAVSLATVMLGQATVFDQQGSELLRSKSFERDSYDSGDWYNRVDYTKSDNNYDVGLPRKDKDGDNYPLIKQVKNAAATPGNAELLQMESFYKELTSLRQSSPLFTLGSGTDVMNRVDFRNVGPNAQPGLIAMSIDDGSAVSDLDKAVDGVIVVINATPDSQSIGEFKDGSDNAIDLSGYTLSPVQQALETASIGAGAEVVDGKLNVPAWSAAVFVKAQGDTQGAGLPVSHKQDLSTVAPFGDLGIYLPGSLIGSWNFSDANLFTFTGADYSYALSTDISADFVGDGTKSVEIKVADNVWGDTGKGGAANYGVCTAGAKLTAGTPLTLCAGDAAKGNIALDVTKVGTYHFTFKAMSKDNPTLTLSIEEPAAACALLPDSSEAATLGATKLALRGSHSSWNFDAAYQLSYKGNGIYQVKVTGPLDMSDSAQTYNGFKVASDDGSWTTQFIAASGGNAIKPLEFDKSYELYGYTAGTEDLQKNTLNLGAGEYIFQIKFDSVPTKNPATVGSMQVCQLQ